MFDVAIAGLGGMGSAILAECARRGASAIGFEKFSAAHSFGSSTGRTRLIRKAYFEDPAYVPLLHRSYELWRELENATSEELLSLTGVLIVGREESPIVRGVERAAGEHQLVVERWTKREVEERYPTLLVRPGEIGVFEADGGVLRPEAAIRAQLRRARAAGAEMLFETSMTQWQHRGGRWEITLSNGNTIAARALVLSTGPWLRETFDSLGVAVQVQRNVQAWFTSTTDAYDVQRFPGFLIDRPELPAPLYGFPDFGDGVKLAFHGSGSFTDPDHVQREIDQHRDIEPLVRAADEWMPGAAGTFRDAKVCMYTLTPDHHFVIDRPPGHEQLVVCGGFSGHGFKFAPVVGEIVAELVLNGSTRHEIEFLSLRRFTR
jgi:sarcosine oxidase